MLECNFGDVIVYVSCCFLVATVVFVALMGNVCSLKGLDSGFSSLRLRVCSGWYRLKV